MTKQFFFNSEAEDLCLSSADLSKLVSCGGRKIDKEDVPFQLFPSVLQRFECYSTYVLAPSAEIDSILIPYETFDHGEKTFRDIPLSRIVEEVIDTQFEEVKWIASGVPGQFFFVEFRKFSYELLHSFESGNMIYPFFVFDATLKNCFGFDWDFEYSFLSSQTLTDSPHFRRDLLPQWDAYFDSDFPPEFARNDPDTYRHQDIYDRFLRPSLGR